MDDPQAAMRWIDECKKLGVSIALDDFGTGFSSLGYLHQFQVDVLKIDRCFINAMGENERAARVVRAVAGLAQGLNLVVVAEGIEEAHQIKALSELECELVKDTSSQNQWIWPQCVTSFEAVPTGITIKTPNDGD